MAVARIAVGSNEDVSEVVVVGRFNMLIAAGVVLVLDVEEVVMHFPETQDALLLHSFPPQQE